MQIHFACMALQPGYHYLLTQAEEIYAHLGWREITLFTLCQLLTQAEEVYANLGWWEIKLFTL